MTFITDNITSEGYFSGTTLYISSATISNISILTNLTASTISATTYQNLPTDIRVTGGTYSNGTATFTNNTGGTFTVNGFNTSVDTFITGFTYNNNLFTISNSTGGTNSVLVNTMTGLTATTLSATTYIGGGTGNTVTTGGTQSFIFGNANTASTQNVVILGNNINGSTSGTTYANTISATTYQNLPIDIRITGGTPDNTNRLYTFKNNTGGTFTVVGLTDVTTTAFTYNNNLFTLTNNTGGTNSVLVNTMTGLTVNGTLSATTTSGGTIYATKELINTSVLDVNNPERLLVDDGTSVSAFSNTIIAKANTNNYAQINITNSSSGNTSSSDLVATANNGNETTNFIDVGINSSSFNGTLGVANDAYLYSTGNNLWVGNAVPNKSLYLFTDGTSSSNIRVTITSGNTLFNVPVSATTYLGLPTDIRITGGTYTSGTATFTNNTGGTFSVTGFTTGGTTSGSWTPSITVASGTAPVYATKSGRWVAMGGRYFCDVYCTGDGGAEGSGTGQISVSLPFSASSNQLTGYAPVGTALNGSVRYTLNGQIAPSASTITLNLLQYNPLGLTNPDDVFDAAMTGGDQSNTTRTLRLQFWYEA